MFIWVTGDCKSQESDYERKTGLKLHWGEIIRIVSLVLNMLSQAEISVLQFCECEDDTFLDKLYILIP